MDQSPEKRLNCNFPAHPIFTGALISQLRGCHVLNRHARRFPVCSFDQPNGRRKRRQRRNVVGSPVEICLQADADIRERRARAPV